MKIKRGDMVKVVSGNKNIKGTVQKVISVDCKAERVVLENGPVKKRHLKPERNKKHPEGGILEKPASVHVSNLMLMSETAGAPVRVGFSVVSGEKVRVARGKRAAGERV